ncbi:CRISPR-associated endonuclease Cas1 [Clostridium acetireducens DSM 10703]|uniref:CRISPR-associated endonuclease Cas1 n=1 Tax=Clostridium acetireducens DSM 10703 TaxID=1121290 RepID=A0A1E8F0U5_9CLOT|nr:CRISPR-associated endonuclease Cas1 [Clostridium acetireducens DSM 10703]
MKTLYIIDQGCSIKKDNISFLISKNGVKLTTIPVYKIENIFIFGNQQITSQALNLAFKNNIDILFLTISGGFKGKISGKFSKNVYLRLAQYDIWSKKNIKINYAKSIIRNKIIRQN